MATDLVVNGGLGPQESLACQTETGYQKIVQYCNNPAPEKNGGENVV